jgi:hypothetical protein
MVARWLEMRLFLNYFFPMLCCASERPRFLTGSTISVVLAGVSTPNSVRRSRVGRGLRGSERVGSSGGRAWDRGALHPLRVPHRPLGWRGSGLRGRLRNVRDRLCCRRGCRRPRCGRPSVWSNLPDGAVVLDLESSRGVGRGELGANEGHGAPISVWRHYRVDEGRSSIAGR